MIKENLLLTLIEKWACISSCSTDEKGLEIMLETLFEDFSLLKPDTIKILPEKILHLTKRKDSPIQILFGGHCDTVFTPQSCPVALESEHILRGAGVADMKGGLAILLLALSEFENSTHAKSIGWEIFINTDEEIGSNRSATFIQTCAKRCDLSLLFEPCLPDGQLVSSRKGSVNYVIKSQGKTAHAGRDFAKGKSAIIPLANFIAKIDQLQKNTPGAILNVGCISGGIAANVVPDFAQASLNLRDSNSSEMERLDLEIKKLADSEHLDCERLTFRGPKPFDDATEQLFHLLKETALELEMEIDWKETGGVCDGNLIAEAGTPCIDTLGCVGGNLHTANEYIEIDELHQRKELVVHFLETIATKKGLLKRRKK